MLIIRMLNCIDAASGIVTLSKWLSGAQVEREYLSLCMGGVWSGGWSLTPTSRPDATHTE